MKKLLMVLLVIALAASFCFAAASTEKAASTTVEYKDTAVIGFQTKTSSISPPTQTSVMHRLFFNLTHDTLVDYDEESASLVPGLAKKYAKAVYCHRAYLTYIQSISFEMPGWMKHTLESRLLGEMSITSDMQMTPPLWQKVKRNSKAS